MTNWDNLFLGSHRLAPGTAESHGRFGAQRLGLARCFDGRELKGRSASRRRAKKA